MGELGEILSGLWNEDSCFHNAILTKDTYRSSELKVNR